MFAEKLREYRKKHNLTILEMANFLGVANSTYGNWEFKMRTPDKLKQSLILKMLEEEESKRGTDECN